MVFNSRTWEIPIRGKKRGDKDKGEIDETKSACHRCGGRSHWACNCRTLKYLVDLYQESLEKKNKKMETNFTSGDNIFYDNIFSAIDIREYDHNTATHLDVFISSPKNK